MQLLLTSDSTVAAPVLLLINVSPADATRLTKELRTLSAATATPILVAPGSSDGPATCLIARVATTDSGCRFGETDAGARVLYCDLTPGTWDQVADLLEPLTEHQPTHAHQYLSDQGPITWIASSDSTW
jgi:hypothetical protein